MNFPFETNGKLMILGVPILMHFRVYQVWLYTVVNNFVKRSLDINDMSINNFRLKDFFFLQASPNGEI